MIPSPPSLFVYSYQIPKLFGFCGLQIVQSCSVSQCFWSGRAKEMVKVVLFTPANFSEMETAPSSPSKKTTLIISLKYLLNQVSYCLSFPYEWRREENRCEMFHSCGEITCLSSAANRGADPSTWSLDRLLHKVNKMRTGQRGILVTEKPTLAQTERISLSRCFTSMPVPFLHQLTTQLSLKTPKGKAFHWGHLHF